MTRPIWRGSLSFGLVNIPVEVHRAVRDHRPKFRMLHAKDVSPVRMDYVCQRDGQRVAWGDLVKGYEYQKGRFVVLTKEDFQSAALEKTKAIEIVSFVEAAKIDDRFFETPYYLVPATNGQRAFVVLREAIKATGRIGIATFILREAQHLAAVEVIDEALVLSVIRFANELVDAHQFQIRAPGKPGKQELHIAQLLVESLASDWDPSKYADQYTGNLMRIIEGKIKGKKEVRLESAAQRRPANVVDLMERLRRSLEQAGKSRSRLAKASHKGGTEKRARGRRKTHAA
jgi:DNA end-binding protein Ku